MAAQGDCINRNSYNQKKTPTHRVDAHIHYLKVHLEHFKADLGSILQTLFCLVILAKYMERAYLNNLS